MPDRLRRIAVLACVLIAAGMLASLLLSLNRGLEGEDESTNLYMLSHPWVPSQFLDHQLWGPVGRWFGGTVTVYRLMPLPLAMIAALVLALPLMGFLRREGAGAVAPLVAGTALVGAIGIYGLIRPTINYAMTAALCGDIVAGLVLAEWLRVPRRLSFAIAAAIGMVLVPLFMARPIAGVAVFVAALAGLGLQPGREGRVPALLVLACTFAAGLATAALAGVSFARALEISAIMTRAYMTPAEVLRAEVIDLSTVGGAGLAAAAGVLIGGRVLARRVTGGEASARGWLAVASVLVINAAVLIDQRAVIGSAPGAAVALYGTTYGNYALVAEFGALALLGWWRERKGAARLAVLALLILAAWLPFAGTHSRMVPKSGINALAINLAVLVAAWCAVEGWPRLHARLLPVTALALAAVTGLFTFLNLLWSPYGAERWTLQTVPLPAPAVVRGLMVTPAQARQAADVRGVLARIGFDPVHDRVIVGYHQTLLQLFADAPIAAHPFVMAPHPSGAAHLYPCDGARKALAPAVRRIVGLNIENFSPALRRCLAGLGLDMGAAPRLAVSPTLVVRVIRVRGR